MGNGDNSAKIPGGYFIIAKKMFEGELMNKPPLHMKLWIWMLNEANWKDRDKLSRGRFHTSIHTMQEAMSYKAGYRKITPTKDEIRNAYEAFTKATMITTTKTTRGMIVTICNYSFYQNFKNYEAHNETHNENCAEPTEAPHDTEGCLKKESKTSCPKPKKPVSDVALRLSNLLADMIVKNNPQNRSLNNGKRDRTVQSWSADIDKILRIDRQPAAEIEKVIRWSQAHSFWSGQILSGGNLREKWDKLTAQMRPAAQPPLQLVKSEGTSSLTDAHRKAMEDYENGRA